MIDAVNKRRFFFDADGVLFVFDQSKSLEEVCAPGYFQSVTSVPNVVNAFRTLIDMGEDVYILTKVFEDGHSRNDKMISFMRTIPELDRDHILFVSYSGDKNDVVKNISSQDILIDDFTPNCKSWRGTAVKLYNGYNGTKGTWDGFSVNANSCAESIAKQLLGIASVA